MIAPNDDREPIYSPDEMAKQHDLQKLAIELELSGLYMTPQYIALSRHSVEVRMYWPVCGMDMLNTAAMLKSVANYASEIDRVTVGIPRDDEPDDDSHHQLEHLLAVEWIAGKGAYQKLAYAAGSGRDTKSRAMLYRQIKKYSDFMAHLSDEYGGRAVLDTQFV